MTHVGVGWLDDDDTPKLVSRCSARKRLTAKATRSKHTVKKVTATKTFVAKLLTAAAATPLDGEPRGKAPDVIRLGSDCSGYGSEFLAMKYSNLPVKTVFCSEIDPDKVVLLRRTHHVFKDEDFVLYPDITKRDNSKAPECDIFISGAPCQAYSAAGRGAGLDDMQNRGITLFYSLDYVRHKKPRVVIIENVRGLTFKKHAHVLADIVTVLTRLGYKITKRVCDTRDHGIPQSRPRLYIIAILRSCYARKYPWPNPVKAPSLLRFVDDSKARKDSIKDLCETGWANVQYWRRKKNTLMALTSWLGLMSWTLGPVASSVT
jgi:DNA-cytosine methyltransferase